MYRRKICLGLSDDFGIPQTEQPEVLKRIGFEEFFISDCDRKAPVEELAKKSRDIDMHIQSLHAPFNKSDDMWDVKSDLADIAEKELLKYVEICAGFEIPIMVTHTWIGFDEDKPISQEGIARYGNVAIRATELGVKLALENTEGRQYLGALMDNLKSEKSVGFCWDSGHEQCYNYGEDLLGKYGDRLLCTHLNDNLGISDYNGKIFWTDDLHLLPFDGIIDWKKVGERLNKCGYTGTLTFELNRRSKPNRMENDIYSRMSPEEYLTNAYIRACRVAAQVG